MSMTVHEIFLQVNAIHLPVDPDWLALKMRSGHNRPSLGSVIFVAAVDSLLNQLSVLSIDCTPLC